MQGQSTQPVQVRSKEVSVHLGSYPGDGEGDQTVGAPGTAIRFGRVSVLPVFEVFNVNNSDAIISYVTTNALAATYLAPNSIMQGRMFGFGVTTRW